MLTTLVAASSSESESLEEESAFFAAAFVTGLAGVFYKYKNYRTNYASTTQKIMFYLKLNVCTMRNASYQIKHDTPWQQHYHRSLNRWKKKLLSWRLVLLLSSRQVSQVFSIVKQIRSRIDSKHHPS